MKTLPIRRKAEAKIAYMAHHDALTDLPNRLQFYEQTAANAGEVKARRAFGRILSRS